MAILYLDNQTSYTTDSKINEKIFPCKLRHFNIEASPLPSTSMILAGAVTFSKDAHPDIILDIENNMRPHINHTNEEYFLLEGDLIFYLKINSVVMALLLQAGDTMYYDGTIEHWISPTKKKYFSLICYKSQNEGQKVFTSKLVGSHFKFLER